jgi:hypothetical protein
MNRVVTSSEYRNVHELIFVISIAKLFHNAIVIDIVDYLLCYHGLFRLGNDFHRKSSLEGTLRVNVAFDLLAYR